MLGFHAQAGMFRVEIAVLSGQGLIGVEKVPLDPSRPRVPTRGAQALRDEDEGSLFRLAYLFESGHPCHDRATGAPPQWVGNLPSRYVSIPALEPYAWSDLPLLS